MYPHLKLFMLTFFPGTIYLQNALGYRLLRVDHGNRPVDTTTFTSFTVTSGMTFLAQNQALKYFFDEINIINKGLLAMNPSGVAAGDVSNLTHHRNIFDLSRLLSILANSPETVLEQCSSLLGQFSMHLMRPHLHLLSISTPTPLPTLLLRQILLLKEPSKVGFAMSKT